jgi:hypothetical protein
MSSCPDHLTQRSLKITNYIKVQGPSASRKLQASPPPTATTNPSPAANDEEESLAITDLKEPHRHEALKRAAIDTRHRGRDEDAVGRTSAGDAPKLHNPSVLRKMNLLSLINPSSAYVYCSILLSNHRLIRLKRFVSQNSLNLCI